MSSNRLGYIRLYSHLDKIFFLFFSSFLTLDYLWRPLNSQLAAWLLDKSGFQFLSYTNVIWILTHRPLVTIGLLLLFILNLLVAYFQIIYLFKGLYHLFDEERLGLKAFLQETWRDSLASFDQFRITKIIFVSCYIFVFFPILGKLLNIYYLNKILIPTFIMDYLLQQVWPGLGILLLGFMVFVLAIRWMFSLPQILFEGASVREAIVYSQLKTRKRWWYYLGKLIWLSMKTTIFYLSSVGILLSFQFAMDHQTWSRHSLFHQVFALLNFSLLKLLYYMIASYFLLKFMGILTEKELPKETAKQHPLLRMGIVTVAMVFFAIDALEITIRPWETKPLVISHRGVSKENGVQNTLESLIKTEKLKPDLIEMDIRETKDGQFVLMHDPNLKTLAGIDATTNELTLGELTQIEVAENGYKAKISSFEAYLNKADELGQKLLIEIKTSTQDTPDMMERFLKMYGKRIKEKGHEIHSLDYHVIDAVVKYDALIPAFFILPYNTIFPQTKATGYTMEYSTLDQYFIERLWHSGKKVYDWTINDETAIRKSFQLNVDGIITDDVELVQENINDEFENPNFSELLFHRALDDLSIFASAT